MIVLFVPDLHGSKWKCERLLEATKDFGANVVINGSDMLPWNNEPFRQGEFITNYLDNHFHDSTLPRSIISATRERMTLESLSALGGVGCLLRYRLPEEYA